MKSLPLFAHQVTGPVDAPWLTFIPGIGNDATFWRAQVQALSDSFRVITFDPWGHADSPAPPPDCGFQDVVQGVIQLWDALGVQRSSVVGLGFGGSVALALGLDAPQRVDRVVGCACRPRQPDDRREFWRQRREAVLQQGIGPLADVTVDRWLSPQFRASHPAVDVELRSMMKRTTPEGYRAYVAAFIEMDLEARLPEITVPVLLVAAEHDHGGGPVEDMRAMAARMPGTRLEIVTGSGHIVNHEAPQAVTALLRDFLQPA